MTLRYINTISLNPVSQEWAKDCGFYHIKHQGIL